MRTRLILPLVVVASVVGMSTSAGAITWGREDVNNEYPNVASVRGIVEAQNLARVSCSGSLLHRDADKVVILTVTTAEVPHVRRAERADVEEIGEGFYRVTITYGFMDEPDIPRELARLDVPELRIAESEVSYFLGHETLFATNKPGLARWRERLFVLMSRNAQRATAFFRIPPERVIEVGVQVEL